MTRKDEEVEPAIDENELAQYTQLLKKSRGNPLAILERMLALNMAGVLNRTEKSFNLSLFKEWSEYAERNKNTSLPPSCVRMMNTILGSEKIPEATKDLICELFGVHPKKTIKKEEPLLASARETPPPVISPNSNEAALKKRAEARAAAKKKAAEELAAATTKKEKAL